MKIKFSHVYPKLWRQTSAELLGVRIVTSKQFTEDLLEYDTRYEDGYYLLPNGEYLQLIFLGNKHIPFCTLRRRTPEKEKYYRSAVGQIFEIIIDKK